MWAEALWSCWIWSFASAGEGPGIQGRNAALDAGLVVRR